MLIVKTNFISSTILNSYILELSMIEYAHLQFSCKIEAAAAIYLVYKLRLKKPWTFKEQTITGFEEEAIKECSKF